MLECQETRDNDRHQRDYGPAAQRGNIEHALEQPSRPCGAGRIGRVPERKENLLVEAQDAPMFHKLGDGKEGRQGENRPARNKELPEFMAEQLPDRKSHVSVSPLSVRSQGRAALSARPL